MWAWCTRAYSWPFWLPGYIVGSYWACHQPEHPDLFLQGCSPTSCPPVCTYIQDYIIPGAESEKCYVVGDCIALWQGVTRSLCKASLFSRQSTPPSNSVSSANLVCTQILCSRSLTHTIAYQSSSIEDILSRRESWKTVSKALPKLKLTHIHWLPFLYKVGNLVIKGFYVSKLWLTFHEPMLALTDDCIQMFFSISQNYLHNFTKHHSIDELLSSCREHCTSLNCLYCSMLELHFLLYSCRRLWTKLPITFQY